VTIPGRILVVDNVEEDVRDLINELMKKGENVSFTEPFFEDDSIFRNVRLVIFDYYLIEEDIDESLNTISLFINSIYKRTKFFMIAIWSAKIAKENGAEVAKNIRNNYFGNYETELPGVLLPPFSKHELNSSNLIQQLKASISKNPDLELLYEIENILDIARDVVVSNVYEIGNWASLVENLEKEVGSDSINRHVMEIYVNIVKRYLKPTDGLDKILRKMLKSAGEINPEKFGKIFFLQNYYYVPENERLWTGDVLVSSEKNEYAVTITPECDFAQNRCNAVRIIECERINHSDLNKPKVVEMIMKKYGLNSPKAVINALFKERSQLRQNYYSIPFLSKQSEEDFFHLILDFDKTRYLSNVKFPSDKGGYSRVCRIDTPLINKVQQRFAAQCSRIGTMSIPEKLTEKLKENVSS